MIVSLFSMAWDAPTMVGVAEVTNKQCDTVSEARRRFRYALKRLRAEGFSLSQSNNLVEARDGDHLVKLYMWAPGPAKMLNPAKLLKIKYTTILSIPERYGLEAFAAEICAYFCGYAYGVEETPEGLRLTCADPAHAAKMNGIYKLVRRRGRLAMLRDATN
jgi:hypothetical protein